MVLCADEQLSYLRINKSRFCSVNILICLDESYVVLLLCYHVWNWVDDYFYKNGEQVVVLCSVRCCEIGHVIGNGLFKNLFKLLCWQWVVLLVHLLVFNTCILYLFTFRLLPPSELHNKTGERVDDQIRHVHQLILVAARLYGGQNLRLLPLFVQLLVRFFIKLTNFIKVGSSRVARNGEV